MTRVFHRDIARISVVVESPSGFNTKPIFTPSRTKSNLLIIWQNRLPAIPSRRRKPAPDFPCDCSRLVTRLAHFGALAGPDAWRRLLEWTLTHIKAVLLRLRIWHNPFQCFARLILAPQPCSCATPRLLSFPKFAMPKQHRFDHKKFLIPTGKKLKLSKRSTEAGNELDDKVHGIEALANDVSSLKEAQRLLYASGTHSLLIIFQGMDAAGKDSTIRHVMGAVNPQGCRVYSFKAPNDVELKHHFLWRPMPCLPERGMISIFNRSYYEEVLVVRVHPQYLEPQKLPQLKSLEPKHLDDLWKQRFEEINAFEKTLALNGTLVLKFYLHVSRDEQKQRFLERLTEPDKHWKFNARDLKERALWPEYENAFEDALAATSQKWAPWYCIPADNKWYARAAIADIIAAQLESLDLEYPEVPSDEREQFDALAEQLRQE